VVRRPAEAPPGAPLSIRVAEGRFGATSTGTQEQQSTETGELND
jgi:exodeoxyribonuclease VII large subunit